MVLRLLVALGLLAAPAAAENRAVVFVVDRALTAAKIAEVHAAFKAIAFHRGDRVGVVAFGKTATIVHSVSGGPSRGRVVPTGEPTNLVAGLATARAMARRVRGPRHLVVVVTDRDHGTDFEEVVAKLRADNIEVAAVSPEGRNVATLKALARLGGGHHYTTYTSLALRAAFQAEVDEVADIIAHVFVIDQTLREPELARARDQLERRLESIPREDAIGIVAMSAQPTVLADRHMSRSNTRSRVVRLTTVPGPADRDAALVRACDLLADVDAYEQPVELVGANDITTRLACAPLPATVRTTGAAPRMLRTRPR